MLCPSCQTDNDLGRKFCRECGGPLSLVCPSCGRPNDPSDKFCGECGSALGPAAGASAGRPGTPSAGPEPPAAERRLVSVLFADLVGFTTLSESRDSEEVRDLLSRYFDTCRRVIGLYVLLSGGVFPICAFIAGAISQRWGVSTALFCGGLTGAIALAALRLAWRRRAGA